MNDESKILEYSQIEKVKYNEKNLYDKSIEFQNNLHQKDIIKESLKNSLKEKIKKIELDKLNLKIEQTEELEKRDDEKSKLEN